MARDVNGQFDVILGGTVFKRYFSAPADAVAFAKRLSDALKQKGFTRSNPNRSFQKSLLFAMEFKDSVYYPDNNPNPAALTGSVAAQPMGPLPVTSAGMQELKAKAKQVPWLAVLGGLAAVITIMQARKRR